MGRPYLDELAKLQQTYLWALDAPIDELSRFVSISQERPLIAVGSGGSLTVAHLASLLHEQFGIIGKSMTPYELLSSENCTYDASVLLLTAGGRNSDILRAFQSMVIAEPYQVLTLCMTPGSRLSNLSRKFRYSQLVEFDPPAGKDGFLATNSLLGMATILTKSYNRVLGLSDLPRNLVGPSDAYSYLRADISSILHRDTWLVLYGASGFPAAADIESKFSEAALGNVQLADFRNFAHGRHNWLAKRSKESAVLAFVTPSDHDIAKRTLGLIPDWVPRVEVSTDQTGIIGSLDLIVKASFLVGFVGLSRGFDPGKPGVPKFGSRIYNLNVPVESQGNHRMVSSDGAVCRADLAIRRKLKRYTSLIMEGQCQNEWSEAYQRYIKRLEHTTYGAIVLDYDGTLCRSHERFQGVADEVIEEIKRLLDKQVVVGVATGRGVSVRNDLQRALSRDLWENVWIGYYNGSDIARLDDDRRPDKDAPLDNDLRILQNYLVKNSELGKLALIEYRPHQISFEAREARLAGFLKATLFDIVHQLDLPRLHVLESTHSLDVITPNASKVYLVAACSEVAKNKGLAQSVLCIGDKGAWPGNDYYLLSTPYSLSVDTVSLDTESCWNLSLPGYRGVQATLHYLQSIRATKRGFRLKLQTH